MASEKKQKSSLEELFSAKEKIEQSIKSEFQEYVAIMFTDIAGYTHYVETHGDIAAKSLLHVHNDIIFPIIEAHSGRVIKTIGDAIMASFKETENGVKAAVEIQSTLKRHNADCEPVKQINIRIGMNAGPALRDGDDYFGDAVNVAARIEPAGSAGQIMVSESVYETIKDDNHIFSSFHGTRAAKGKADPLKLYRVFLNQDDQVQYLSKSQKPVQQPDVEGTLEPVSRLEGRWMNWKYTLPACFLVLAFLVYTTGYNPFDTKTRNIIEKYISGFTYLKNGELGKAEEKFLEIRKDWARSREGLAALAYKNRDYTKADQYSDDSLKSNSDLLYPRVIKANILFDRGLYDEAGQLYSQAAGLDPTLEWQKAEALFRLGRISSFKGDPSKALAYYDEAMSFDRQNSDIITAKGVLLEKMGKLEQAVEYLRTAKQMDPGNRMATVFSSRIQEKLKAAQNKEHQAKIDRLVSELIRTMAAHKRQPSDRWTSRPLNLFFANVQRKGMIPLQEGADEFFKLELIDRLRQVHGVSLVDRDLLDKLLDELKIGSSDLADPDTALRLGRLAAARLIGNLTFMGLNNETRVYLKLIETETSEIKTSVSEKFSSLADQDRAVETMVARVAEKITSDFPMRGRIIQIDNNSILMNIGSNVGLENGMIMGVYAAGSGIQKRTGAVRVTAVEEQTARGQIIKGRESIKKSHLLEKISL